MVACALVQAAVACVPVLVAVVYDLAQVVAYARVRAVAAEAHPADKDSLAHYNNHTDDHMARLHMQLNPWQAQIARRYVLTSYLLCVDLKPIISKNSFG